MASHPAEESFPARVGALKLEDEVPNFVADSTQGSIRWHDFIARTWAVLFTHPANYTPVCTTELAEVAAIHDEFLQRGVKVAALSCDDSPSHEGWKEDIEATDYIRNKNITYPIISDPDRTIAAAYGMVDPGKKKMPGIPVTCRAVFIIGPDCKLKSILWYPLTTGRNFAEILRVIDSLQLTSQYSVATPANWKQGSKCLVQPWLTDEQAKDSLGDFSVEQVPSGKRYLRTTNDPSGRRGPIKAAREGGLKAILGIGGALLVGFLGGRMSNRPEEDDD
ncbi:hypothetical protein BSKO_10615 [Bryopsis sp. KO-2023]|nr:hypothetical protein BSKO_10615 [Bryopsis sp. KO-2023]